MRFRSLFIGIDKYRSPLISNLSCSVRDAQALYGLFADTFGEGDSTLLTNDQATRGAILVALQQLQQSDLSDLVVIGFSGHGSDCHHLVSADADPLHLDTTAIHLSGYTRNYLQAYYSREW